MKKLSLVAFLLFFGLCIQGFSQTTSKDFFAGPWEIMVYGTPNGDAKMTTNLKRVDGKLTGELSSKTGENSQKIRSDEVVETSSGISILFSAEGNDVNIDLAKKDDNNLEGNLMGMFTAKAKRLSKP